VFAVILSLTNWRLGTHTHTHTHTHTMKKEGRVKQDEISGKTDSNSYLLIKP